MNGKIVNGIRFAMQMLVAERQVALTADEAYEYLNSINPNVKSSCWLKENLAAQNTRGGV